MVMEMKTMTLKMKKMTVKKAVMTKRREATQDNVKIEINYVYCDFILGSSAEIERVWSTATHIVALACTGMYPITLEAILFLHYNKSWWGGSP